ncbi:serine/arginine repetitive matrix protein 1-like [Schistocerca cancellata]|uniref:serine/arginine repetitive matrix protein 1-like n=1 Tax=Schistocerca cancellata TaxID=274614 RepID=UPI0021180ADE|nr:serine/arginine repetitive matrix protein 1-like [Schistocerca cancellata]
MTAAGSRLPPDRVRDLFAGISEDDDDDDDEDAMQDKLIPRPSRRGQASAGFGASSHQRRRSFHRAADLSPRYQRAGEYSGHHAPAVSPPAPPPRRRSCSIAVARPPPELSLSRLLTPTPTPDSSPPRTPPPAPPSTLHPNLARFLRTDSPPPMGSRHGPPALCPSPGATTPVSSRPVSPRPCSSGGGSPAHFQQQQHGGGGGGGAGPYRARTSSMPAVPRHRVSTPNTLSSYVLST